MFWLLGSLSLLHFDSRSILRCLDHWVLGCLNACSDILFLTLMLLALPCSLASIFGQPGLAALAWLLLFAGMMLLAQSLDLVA